MSLVLRHCIYTQVHQIKYKNVETTATKEHNCLVSNNETFFNTSHVPNNVIVNENTCFSTMFFIILHKCKIVLYGSKQTCLITFFKVTKISK